MCSFEKSPETKSCVKTNCTQTPQYRPLRIPEQAAYQTPKNCQLPKKWWKKCQTEAKLFFQTFRWRGAFGPTGKKTTLHPSSNPSKPSLPSPRTNFGTNLACNWARTPIYATTYARFKTLKIRQKLGFEKFSFFFRLKPAPGHGLS